MDVQTAQQEMQEMMTEKIWLKEYPAGVPAEIDADRYHSLVELFDHSCVRFPLNTAFNNFANKITYREFDVLSKAFASYLQSELGLKKGDRFAIMLPNILQYPVAVAGALRAGLIVVNVNPLYTQRELEHQLNDAGAQGIVVMESFAHVLEKALPQTLVKHVIVTNIGDLFPTIKRTVFNFAVKHIKKMIPAWRIPQAIRFTDAIKHGKSSSFLAVELTGDDVAFLQYTGGTTGVSKGAVLTHRNLIANVEQTSAWVAPFMEPGKEIMITALPLYHIFSLCANFLLHFKIGSENVLITNPRDINLFIKLIKNIKFTALTGVNTLFNALLNNPNFAKLDFSNFKLALGGGMAVQAAVAERWREVTKTPLLEAYGLTETSPAVCINPLTIQEFNGYIGLPISSTEVSIRSEEDTALPIGEEGELCVKGPQVMRAYWNKPEETKKVFTPSGWLRTGDIAMMTDNGYVKLMERKKDMILVSGFNVYPNEIENVIAAHPGVLEVAVVGMPHPISGEVVKAYIVKKDADLTEERIIEHCRAELTAYKVPKAVEFKEELPKSNVGKILRRELREDPQ